MGNRTDLRKEKSRHRTVCLWLPAETESLGPQPVFHQLAAKELISTRLLFYFQTVLQKASQLSLTNRAALIYSRERSCRGMCWQTH